MNSGTAAVVVILVLLVCGITYVGVIGYNNWQTGLAYDRDIGGFYEYADRASDAQTKANYFNQYINALVKNDLTNGSNSVFYTNQPTASLEKDFSIATSIQNRLNHLATMNQDDMAYQTGLQEISTTEFCWFPDDAFEQAYFIKHGMWGSALWPAEQINKCVDSTKHS